MYIFVYNGWLMAVINIYLIVIKIFFEHLIMATNFLLKASNFKYLYTGTVVHNIFILYNYIPIWMHYLLYSTVV